MPAALALALALATPAVTIEAPPELAGRAAEVRAVLSGEQPLAGSLTGLERVPASVRVVLAPEGSELAAAAPSWVAGYAVGELDLIVLFPGRVPSYPDRSLGVLVRHELAHLLAHHAAAGGRVPRWFDEGVATVAAREWGIEDAARYGLAVIGRPVRSLAALDHGFAAGGRPAARSYALSAGFVRFLLRERGADCPARILALVARGVPFAEAFERTTGWSLPAAEARFFGREAVWRTWVPFLSSSTALWMAVTLLAIWAIRARRRRDALIRARWQAEDEAAARVRRPGEDEPVN